MKFLGGVIQSAMLCVFAGCSTPRTPAAETCEPVSESELDLMAWDPGARGLLTGIRNQGLAVVRYEANGCDVQLRLLSNCMARGEYAFVPHWESDSKIAKNTEQLFAEFPIGAAGLKSKLHDDRALRTDYMLTGMLQIPIEKNYVVGDLVGECSQATHVVTRIYLGGFALVSGESREIEASASVFSIGAGAKHHASMKRVQRAGDADSCLASRDSRTENPGCATPLRLSLRSLAQHRECFDAAECQARCDSGAPDACVNLGVMYAEGKHIGRDQKRATDLFKLACDKGVPNGCANLGTMYLEGLGVPQDYRRAEQLLQHGCEHDVAWSCSSLAYMYVERLSSGGDLVTAATLYERACHGGDTLGCESARRLRSDLCDAGNGPSCFELARTYFDPNAPPAEHTKGAEFIQKGCNLGHLDSCIQLSALYIRGVGVPRDPDHGVALLEDHCSRGETRACAALGANYAGHNGDGVPREYAKAAELFERACNDGENASCVMLAGLLSEGQGVSKDLPRAISLLQDACDDGFAIGCTALASAYEEGEPGVLPKDVSRAKALYGRACNAGGAEACEALQRLKH